MSQRRLIYDDRENEAKINRNSRLPISKKLQQRGSNGNNITIENSRTNRQNDEMVKAESTSNSQGNDSKSIGNKGINENSEKSSINLSEKVNKQDIANNQEQEYNNINTSTKEDINNDIQRTILKNDSKEENQRDGQFTTRENRRNQEEYRTIKQGIAEEQINKIQ